MSFWDHLDELRGTLIRCAVALVLGCVPGLLFREILFDGVVLAPTRPGFWIYRILGWKFKMSLINVEVSAQFFVHLRCALISGVVLVFPYIIFEIWRFIAPALYKEEKKVVRRAFGFSSVLFYAGVAVGYFFVLPACVQFFMNYTVSDAVSNTITLGSYISLFGSLVLMVGLAFEFPAVILVLNRLGVVGRALLKKVRVYALIIIMVLSAIITPSDPVSMLVLAAPLYLLYELSILLCKDEKPSDVE